MDSIFLKRLAERRGCGIQKPSLPGERELNLDAPLHHERSRRCRQLKRWILEQDTFRPDAIGRIDFSTGLVQNIKRNAFGGAQNLDLPLQIEAHRTRPIDLYQRSRIKRRIRARAHPIALLQGDPRFAQRRVHGARTRI